MSFCNRLARLSLLCAVPASLAAQTKAIPDWCKALPRPEYRTLMRVPVSDPWFEVYKVAPGTFAIYEPHQAEETISYLILGTKQAVLFDTGMGIGSISKVTNQLTAKPVVVLNSHTHNDHVGGNWEFTYVFAMDTDFTRKNARGSPADAQAEIASGQICGKLPAGFNPKTYATKQWKIFHFVHDGFKVNLGARTVEIVAAPGHTDRPCQRLALHRRYLLSRADLAVPPRNRYGCVRCIGQASRGARAASENGARRAQHTCGGSGGAAETSGCDLGGARWERRC